MRGLLVQAASCVLREIGRFCALKAWAVRLAARRGYSKAAVATARKIAVLMLTLWKKETEYKPMISENDPPPIELNTAIMERFRPEMQKFYFDETKYDTYLEQLGVEYPTVRED